MIQYYNPYFIICTFFGLGRLSKKFPGTIGSVIAIPVSFLLLKISNFILNHTEINSYLLYFTLPIILVFALFLIGVYASNHYAKLLKKNDPQEIIIDEVVGQALCILITTPLTFGILSNENVAKNFTLYPDLVLAIALLCNLILFRIFDIFKPWPISWCDQKIKGGLGIMLDDVLAAVFAVVVYFAVLFLIIDWL